MQININAAEIKNNQLVITAPKHEILNFVKDFKPETYEIKSQGKRRSLNANSYAWMLIGKIAKAIQDVPDQVYVRCIRDYGAMISIIRVPAENVEIECRTFLRGHIGRFVEIGELETDGWVDIKKYYGSSDFNTEQMAAFIEYIIQDCRCIGIDIEPQEYINSLLEEWNG